MTDEVAGNLNIIQECLMGNNKDKQENPGVESKRKNWKVMVVEDDTVWKDAIEKWFTKLMGDSHNIDYEYCANAAECTRAINLLKKNKEKLHYDIIFMDMNLGQGASGLDLLKDISVAGLAVGTIVITNALHDLDSPLKEEQKAGLSNTVNEWFPQRNYVINKLNRTSPLEIATLLETCSANKIVDIGKIVRWRNQIASLKIPELLRIKNTDEMEFVCSNGSSVKIMHSEDLKFLYAISIKSNKTLTENDMVDLFPNEESPSNKIDTIRRRLRNLQLDGSKLIVKTENGYKLCTNVSNRDIVPSPIPSASLIGKGGGFSSSTDMQDDKGEVRDFEAENQIYESAESGTSDASEKVSAGLDNVSMFRAAALILHGLWGRMWSEDKKELKRDIEDLRKLK